MPNVPTCKPERWKSRSLETSGYMDFVAELASWAGLGSDSFPFKILNSLKEVREIGRERLSPDQVTRSIRLRSILKNAFANHPRASLLIKNYEETHGYHRVSGYETLRLLGLEFGIKSRTELLYFRQQLLNSSDHEGTIPESVRRVQYELF